jgi:hypothetical protein
MPANGHLVVLNRGGDNQTNRRNKIMYEITITGNLAHDNKYFNATCKDCGGLYDINKGINCPKCGRQLVYLTDRDGRPMGISEGTFYPEKTKEEKERLERTTANRKNGMPLVYRFSIFSFADKETSILEPHPLHQYLAIGRRIMFKFTREPLVSYFESKDPKFPIQCELKFVYFESHDKIEFQDKKKEIAEAIQLPGPAETLAQLPQINIPMENMTVEQLCAINLANLSAEEKILYGKILELRLLTLQSEQQAAPPAAEMTANTSIPNPFDSVQ